MKTGVFYANVKEAYPNVEDDLILLRNVKKYGYSHIDIDCDELLKKSDEFFNEAEGLSIGFSVYAFADENCVLNNGIKAEDCLPFLSEHKVKNLMMVCIPAVKAESKEKVNTAIENSLNHLCDCAEKFGMTISVEDFDSHSIPCGSCEDMLYFGEKVPKLKYTFDTGNFAFFGEDALECFEKLKDRISHVHLKDRVSYENLQVTATGEGFIPMQEIIERLAECKYEGVLSVEMFGAGSTPRLLKEASDFVRKIIPVTP